MDNEYDEGVWEPETGDGDLQTSAASSTGVFVQERLD